MAKPTFDLLHYLVRRLPETKYGLASSNLPTVSLELPDDLASQAPGEPHLEGSLDLREQIARLTAVPSDRVLATAGASEANLLVGLALLERGNRVVVERPTYEPLWKVFELLGADVSFLHRPFARGFGLDREAIAELERTPPRLLVLTNLHNPGGVRLDREDLGQLAELAESGDFRILMDEMYRETALDRVPPCALTLSDRFIVTSGVSKVYGLGGLRLYWCLAAPDLLGALRHAKDFASVAPALLSDALSVQALAHAEETRRRNRRLIAGNRSIVSDWIADEDALEWVPPAGHVSFPRYEGDVDRLASVALHERGVLVAPGRLFGAPSHFRLCFGLEDESLIAGLQGLTQTLREV